MTEVKIKQFVDALGLEVFHRSTDYHEAVIDNRDINRPGLQLIGHFEKFPYKRLQVIGQLEYDFYNTLPRELCYARFDEIFDYDIPALIFSRGLNIRDDILELAKKHNTIILRSSLSTTDLITRMNTMLELMLAEETTIHGVLVEIFGLGVLLLGDSSVGKSETALDLVIRGHRLVADDVVVIKRMVTGLLGTSPENIRHFMEIRGLGILDIGRLYGLGSVKTDEYIDLVIEMKNWQEDEEYDRLGLEEEHYEILGAFIPKVVIPVKTGRNMAMIIEVASRNHRMKTLGYNSAVELNKRLFKKNNRNI